MKEWNSSYVVRAKHKLHNSGQQQKGGIRKVLASSRQGKDTSARGLGVMRDPTKAIMGREQTCEPVVKETLPSRVTWNPRNKQIVSKHCKSSWLCRSSEAICGCKNMWRAGEIQGQVTSGAAGPHVCGFESNKQCLSVASCVCQSGH